MREVIHEGSKKETKTEAVSDEPVVKVTEDVLVETKEYKMKFTPPEITPPKTESRFENERINQAPLKVLKQYPDPYSVKGYASSTQGT